MTRPMCGSDRSETVQIMELLNPNGEFVEGYGCMPVYRITDGSYQVCSGCKYDFRIPPETIKRIPFPTCAVSIPSDV